MVDKLVRQAQGGDSTARNKLISMHMPTIQKNVSLYEKAAIPRTAILGQGMLLANKAIANYNPNKGAAFETHLTGALRGLNRYVESNKRIDRVPENKRLRFGRLQAAESLLRTERGREATVYELADHLGWQPKHVQEIQTAGSQRSLAASGLQGVTAKNTVEEARLKEAAAMKYFGWSPEEQIIYDHLMGTHGKKAITHIDQISKQTGISASKVYRIRNKLANELRSI